MPFTTCILQHAFGNVTASLDWLGWRVLDEELRTDLPFSHMYL